VVKTEEPTTGAAKTTKLYDTPSAPEEKLKTTNIETGGKKIILTTIGPVEKNNDRKNQTA